MVLLDARLSSTAVALGRPVPGLPKPARAERPVSLRTVGYINGKPIRIDEGPAYAGSIRWGGTTSFGGPGGYELNRISSRAKAERERAERAAKA